jgi:hypothetical protein
MLSDFVRWLRRNGKNLTLAECTFKEACIAGTTVLDTQLLENTVIRRDGQSSLGFFDRL